MREYYTEAFYARVLKSNINDKANAQRIHPPHYDIQNICWPECLRRIFAVEQE